MREQRIFTARDGHCFGEWAIVYNQPRTASCKCVEDSDLIMMDKDSFKLCFYKSIRKAEIARQVFLTKLVKPFRSLQSASMDMLYKGMTPYNMEKNAYLYEQGSPAEFVYFLFMGECLLFQSITIRREKERENNRVA